MWWSKIIILDNIEENKEDKILSFPIFQTAITRNPIQQSIQPVLVVVIALF